MDVMLFFSGQLHVCSLFYYVYNLPSVKGNSVLAHDPACGGAIFHCPLAIVGLLQIQNKDVNSICSKEVALSKLCKCL